MFAKEFFNSMGKRVMAGGVSLALILSLTGCPEVQKTLTTGFQTVTADYGDAPDDRDDPQGARFPTKAENNGARHIDITKSALGYFEADGSLPVSAEFDATDLNDPDGVPNLDPSDNDAYDDGFFIGLLPANSLYQLPVVVSVAANAPDQLRYINILADWNRNLEWSGSTGGTEEWVVKNHPVYVTPGTSERILTPSAKMGSQTHDTWFRVTLSEGPIDESAFPNGWDGSGQFDEGETEDYYYVTVPMNEMELDDTIFPPIFPPILPPEDPNDPEDPNEPVDPDELVDPNDDGADQCPGPAAVDPANPDPDGDGNPGIDQKNIGKLKKIGPNTYKLVLCKGKTWYRGFKWETWLRNGRNSNPFTAGVRMTNDPGTITIRARDVGTTTVTFEAHTSTFPVSNNDWVTGTIIVTVIDCEPKCVGGVAADPAGAARPVPVVDPDDPFAGLENAGVDDLNKLRQAGDNTYYLVICICELENTSYERGFQYSTNVRNPQTGDDAVATLGLQNDPGRIRITPTGVGTTTVTFEADVNTFPSNEVRYETITIHVKVIECPHEM